MDRIKYRSRKQGIQAAYDYLRKKVKNKNDRMLIEQDYILAIKCLNLEADLNIIKDKRQYNG